MRDVAPSSRRVGRCETCNTDITEHTLVPRQIENAAKALKLPISEVYGDVWVATDSSEKEEGEAAKACYEYVSDVDFAKLHWRTMSAVLMRENG